MRGPHFSDEKPGRSGGKVGGGGERGLEEWQEGECGQDVKTKK